MQRNLSLKLISVLVALVAWIGVTIYLQKDYSTYENIPVTIVGTYEPEKYVIVEMNPKKLVTDVIVTGPPDKNKGKEGLFVPTVNFAGLRAGKDQKLDIKLNVASGEGWSAEIDPKKSTVTVTVEEITSKTVQIDPPSYPVGEVAKGFIMTEDAWRVWQWTPSAFDKQAKISGPASLLKEVNGLAFKQINVTNLSRKEISAPLLVDWGPEGIPDFQYWDQAKKAWRSGTPLDWLDWPKTRQLVLPLSPVYPTKQVPVNLYWDPVSDPNYRLTDIQCTIDQYNSEKTTVAIKGPQESLNQIDSVTTEPIDWLATKDTPGLQTASPKILKNVKGHVTLASDQDLTITVQYRVEPITAGD